MLYLDMTWDLISSFQHIDIHILFSTEKLFIIGMIWLIALSDEIFKAKQIVLFVHKLFSFWIVTWCHNQVRFILHDF